jgi:GH24 family phage-related lysozyme (muramidase)|tara:strand:- start:286 stop:747 length:462 start_codon:yes stop_codon:yes gene_type:complete
MMQLSKTGIELLKHFEGCELKAYQDSVGVWTIGYGHTKGIYEGLEITQSEAEKMLVDELPEYEGYISDKVVPMLQQHEFDALVCWVYNLGPTNLSSSTMLKKLNAGEFKEVPFQMKRWDKAGGQPLLGLTRRRNAEALLFKGEQWKDYLEVEA